ncbi:MAG: oligogalacturonate lyase family protein [Bryobacteraceae bacterium]|nr:oligogalacturonate lyase family protein [Bryobacteraceae bacterium]
MKGDRFPSEHSTRRDPATGASVHQLTSHPSINHPSYFLQSSFTPDGSSLLFSSYRSGTPQLFAVESFPEGPIRQLTDGPSIHPFSPAMERDGRAVVFVRAGQIWRLCLKTLEETLVVDLGDASLGEPSLSAGGDWAVAAVKKDGRHGLAAGPLAGRGWHIIPFPRTVIHPQFHPLEPEWIEFAADPAPRMFRIRRDGSGLECLYENTNDEFVVHETFLGRTGDLVYTVWPHALWLLDWQTRERRLLCEFNAWHIAPDAAGTRVLCDTNHPDLGLFLINVATGARRRLCLSESSNQGSQWRTSRYALPEDFARAQSTALTGKALSWMEAGTDTVYGPQWTHPHPSFSFDEAWVAFASDRTGYTQVYAVEVANEQGG